MTSESAEKYCVTGERVFYGDMVVSDNMVKALCASAQQQCWMENYDIATDDVDVNYEDEDFDITSEEKSKLFTSHDVVVVVVVVVALRSPVYLVTSRENFILCDLVAVIISKPNFCAPYVIMKSSNE